MRKDVYIFRHGQTDLNFRGIWQGCGVDSLLNEKGKEQAKALSIKVCALGLTNLYCSPMLRAVQTANAIIERHVIGSARTFTVIPDLHECNFGECEGLSFDESKAKYGEAFVEKMLFPTRETWNERFPGGESKQEVFSRVLYCLESIVCSLTNESDCRIGIVCHAGVINSLACGLDLKNVNYDNCSILHLSYDSDAKKWTQVFD